MDLSVGYTATGTGLEFCGCSSEAANCELVHIVFQRQTSNNITEQLDCPDIVLTERWWREENDLVDIYYADTCEELEESATHNDRYEINTSAYEGGDTLSILVCKTNPFDNNIIELSASPGPSCNEFICAPEMTCPVEFKLRLNLECQYVLPDFRLGVSLQDTCQSPPEDVTNSFTLMQIPAPGTVVTEDLFVEVNVSTAEGEIITSCDVSVILTDNTPPVIMQPQDILDIRVGEPLPVFEELLAIDTIANDVLYELETEQLIDPYEEEACLGYSVTYRWRATDSCNMVSELTQTFMVLPNADGPIFASLPADIDTVEVGESLPLLVDLIAVNPDGTTDGITMESMVDPYEEDDCFGYSVTYRWQAIDSCGDMTEISESFYVAPNGAPPVFLFEPDPIEDITTNDTLPLFQELFAQSVDGDTTGIQIIQSIDPFVNDSCSAYQMTYRWTAIDTCGLSTSISRSFEIAPGNLSDFILAGMGDMMIEVSLDCNEFAEIEIPIDIELHPDKIITVIVTDEDWNIVDEYLYEGPTDYEFGNGNSHVIYAIQDQCGNEVRDTIDIFASDVSAPIFACPTEQQIFVTDFATCSTSAAWVLPQAFDNCDELEVVQTSGPQFGASLGVGTYQIEYSAVDGSNNSSSCSFELVVASASITNISCLPLSVELDSFCQAFITKEAIIGTELLVCSPNLTVEVVAGMDTLTGDTFHLGAYYGENITYILCDPILEICCENGISLLDSIAPIIDCQDSLTLSCLVDLDLYTPTVSAECGPVAWQIRDIDYQPVCDDPNIQAQLIREFIAIDLAGNSSLPCVQVINIAYANIDSLYANDILVFPNDTTISCDDYDPLSLSDQIFGFPMIDSISITLESNSCGIKASYTDELYVDAGCTKIIRRHWTIKEEICGYGHRDLSAIQNIKIIDTVAPVLKPWIGTLHLNTSSYDCYGYLVSPPLELSDNCQSEEDLFYVLQYDGVLYEQLDTIRLPLGTNYITVISQDGCNNQSRDTISIEVVDNVIPVAACVEQSVIAITGETARYPVEALDLGSYDNCDVASIQIRKTSVSCSEQDTTFNNYIEFCCEDIDEEVELLLKVVDHAGNENYCWGIVHVQKKVAPEITCPPNLILDCAIPLSKSNNEADPYGHLFGRLEVEEQRNNLQIDTSFIVSSDGPLLDGLLIDFCSDKDQVVVETREEINQCGVGFIYRSFTAIDQSGNSSETCTQVIEIGRNRKLDSVEVFWPEEEIFVEECNTSFAISPDSLGRPVVTEQVCALFGISYEDSYVDFADVTDGTCSKIIRNWTIINWCAENPFENTIEFNQIIKVVDLEAPLIEGCNFEEQYFSSIDDCYDVNILLHKTAIDDCTNNENLSWFVQIDLNNDGTNDLSANLESDSLGVNYERSVPVGSHRVTWTVRDKCGNVASCTEYIFVENAKPPTPIAHGLSTTLSPEGFVSIWADDLIQKIESECALGGTALISRSDENFNQARGSIAFSCEEEGSNIIKVYASRSLENGQLVYDHVTVVVQIEDTNNVCANEEENASSGLVTGLVYTDNGRTLPGVQLELMRAFPQEYMVEGSSDNDGHFDLGEIKGDDTYFINANLDADVLEGVTTLDLVHIQRHVLGMSVFDSPFRIITADANRDGKVSVADILEIRKAILRYPTNFGNNKAWRFIDADYHFFDERYPLDDEIDERVFVRRSASEVDIVAMKVGDVDGSVKISKQEKADIRNVERVKLENISFIEGESFEMQMSTRSPLKFYGFQMSLSYDAKSMDIQNVESLVKDVDLTYHKVSEGLLLITSNSADWSSLEAGQNLISLKCIGKKTGTTQSSIWIGKKNLSSEIYLEDLKPTKLALVFENKPEVFNVGQNTPNPFSNYTEITITSTKEDNGKIEIHDATGRFILVRHIELIQGETIVRINNDDLLGSGIYYYRFSTENESITKRMILLE